jgi:CubicO group peptidase (beta-lactamase class C family)
MAALPSHLPMTERLAREQVNDPRIAGKYASGGGGLLSTATDYARFLQMVANSGTLDGKRYLGARTIAYMTSDDHMGDVVRRGPFDLLGPGVKFGLGFAVRTEAGLAHRWFHWRLQLGWCRRHCVLGRSQGENVRSSLHDAIAKQKAAIPGIALRNGLRSHR